MQLPCTPPAFVIYFFLMVSTTVVLGRRLASLTGMNLPVLASRPIFVVFDFLAMLITSFFALDDSLCTTELDRGGGRSGSDNLGSATPRDED